MSVILSKIKHQTGERILWAMLHGKFNRDENRVSVTEPSTRQPTLFNQAHTRASRVAIDAFLKKTVLSFGFSTTSRPTSSSRTIVPHPKANTSGMVCRVR